MEYKINTINDTRIIKLPKIQNPKGNLTPVHNSEEIPFDIRRVYYLYDVPGGETRGGHAHKELEQFIVCPSGSFDVILDDGKERKTIKLNRSYEGLYVPQLIWREIVNFSTGGICLVLASLPYDENEYIRDYDNYISFREKLSAE
ncbi:MAG: WxcM-like domain-containing protein [Melioribacteraceae bacterium]|nr:WxcM-like domain-containing protein [Melioribacteraceae bacterium]